MNREVRKSIIASLVGGAILGAMGGFAIAFLLALPVAFVAQDYLPIVFSFALLTMIPGCAIGMAWYIARRDYRDQLESSRLHSHFCKRCAYDLRGCTDVVCPECGTPDCLVACGPGVERIADEVAELMPGARVALVTSDTLNTPDKIADFVAAICAGNFDVQIAGRHSAERVVQAGQRS